MSYDVDGEPTAVAIGARELDPEKLAKGDEATAMSTKPISIRMDMVWRSIL